MAETPQQMGFADEEISKEVPTCSSHWLPCCRLQFPWSPWCNCLWGCSVNRLQTWASLNTVYKNALKQILWSSFQNKPINNNSKTNRVEHCIPEHYFVQLCWKNPYIAKLRCETLTESILVAEGIREGRDKNILNNYNFFCILFPRMVGPFRLRYCSNIMNNAQPFSWMVKYSLV